MDNLIGNISSYLNAKSRGNLYLVSSDWYNQMYENDKIILDDLTIKYPNEYNILQYFLIDAVNANDIAIVDRVANGLTSYAPLRWIGIDTPSSQMRSIVNNARKRVYGNEEHYESLDTDISVSREDYIMLVSL